MYREILNSLQSEAKSKLSMYSESKFKYIICSMMAGFFVGLGILIMALNLSIFKDVNPNVVSLVNGLTFSLALSFVMMAGGDLFTGNILVLSNGTMTKGIDYRHAIKICALSYFGNFLGALFLSLIFLGTGIGDKPIAEAIVNLAHYKVESGIMELFFKGIMCNILVCLAVLCCYKMKSESGKLIMIIWAILPFVALGFDHSIANMTVFSLAKMLSSEITFSMIFHNLIPVTIGNIVGGLIVSLTYYMIGKEENK